jgi:D-arabinose 1-dehydrogenase-like Zn-dependent alcohol dehydrogenase
LLETDEVLRLTAEGKVKPLIVPCEMSDLNDMVDQLLTGKGLRARRV